MTDPPACWACGATLKPSAAFCATCGKPTARPVSPRAPVLAIWLYLALLAVQVLALVYVRVTGDTFTAVTGATAGIAVVVLAFYVPTRSRVASAATTAGFRARWYLGIAAASVPIALVVIGYVKGLSSGFGIHMPSELEEFTGHSAIWPILIVIVVPPLVEELAFRGVIYTTLRDTLSAGETLLVSAFAFAMLHLSFPSLLTHLPLGLYFGWLRQRSGSLWPGVFAHACHNALIVALAWAGY